MSLQDASAVLDYLQSISACIGTKKSAVQLGALLVNFIVC